MLPLYMTSVKDLELLQKNWSQLINPVIDAPINKGLLLQSVSLSTGSNIINHKLGRKLLGWFATRVRSSATLYDTQDANQIPEFTLVLVSSANVIVDLFVF